MLCRNPPPLTPTYPPIPAHPLATAPQVPASPTFLYSDGTDIYPLANSLASCFAAPGDCANTGSGQAATGYLTGSNLYDVAWQQGNATAWDAAALNPGLDPTNASNSGAIALPCYAWGSPAGGRAAVGRGGRVGSGRRQVVLLCMTQLGVHLRSTGGSLRVPGARSHTCREGHRASPVLLSARCPVRAAGPPSTRCRPTAGCPLRRQLPRSRPGLPTPLLGLGDRGGGRQLPAAAGRARVVLCGQRPRDLLAGARLAGMPGKHL